MVLMRPHITVLVVLLSSSVVAQQASQRTHDNDYPEQECRKYEQIRLPAQDLPTAADRVGLAKCDSEHLYFGFDRKPDPVRARKCAYLDREKGSDDRRDCVFCGSGLLTMIYANGKGAARNLNLAVKFSCEIDGAPAENYGRLDHLKRLEQEKWSGDNFSLCDDATSGFMQGWCANLDDEFDKVRRRRDASNLESKWTPAQKKAFADLQRVAYDFFNATSRWEEDTTGTGRAAFEIESESEQQHAFLQSIASFEKGKLPRFSSADFKLADGELNSVYQQVQNVRLPSFMSTDQGFVTPEGIKKVERKWLLYREAWVTFGAAKYPAVSSDAWRTWATQQRTKQLRDLLSDLKDVELKSK